MEVQAEGRPPPSSAAEGNLAGCCVSVASKWRLEHLGGRLQPRLCTRHLQSPDLCLCQLFLFSFIETVSSKATNNLPLLVM